MESKIFTEFFCSGIFSGDFPATTRKRAVAGRTGQEGQGHSDIPAEIGELTFGAYVEAVYILILPY